MYPLSPFFLKHSPHHHSLLTSCSRARYSCFPCPPPPSQSSVPAVQSTHQVFSQAEVYLQRLAGLHDALHATGAHLEYKHWSLPNVAILEPPLLVLQNSPVSVTLLTRVQGTDLGSPAKMQAWRSGAWPMPPWRGGEGQGGGVAGQTSAAAPGVKAAPVVRSRIPGVESSGLPAARPPCRPRPRPPWGSPPAPGPLRWLGLPAGGEGVVQNSQPATY